MKYYVLLDSSSTSLSVGIASFNQLIDSISYESWQSQSEHMIPELDKLLKKHDVKKEDIVGVVVATGPGSYTGVRIALTIAKTLAVALNSKIYPVSSLQVQKDGKKPSICLINARSNRSYIGIYQGDKCLLNDQIMTNDLVKEYIQNHPDYIICGKTDYLNIDGFISNICEEMVNLLPSLKPIDNPLALTPLYLKD